MKKTVALFVILLTTLSLSACGKNTTEPKKEKVYDSEFVQTLSKALHDRWAYQETDEYLELQEKNEAEALITATKNELKPIQNEDYPNKKFTDSKLKELAISYGNLLNDSISELKSASSTTFLDKFNELYTERTKLLVEINEIKKIPFEGDDENTFQELLNSGNEFKEQEAFDTKLETLLPTIKFEEQKQEYESEYKTYKAVVENTTGVDIKSFSARVYLEDESGTRVDTQYMNTNDWSAGQKVTFEFTTNKKFTKITIVKDYVELAK
ncbi:FxLYD domain-containing protein [Enterococcus asini]|uniref:FxLYD domain-containing protein n=1 Tax=Enterococcus asini TaxID=57732 RepID=UPI00241C9DF0|nr:FxLYD domain-containing protein [Enterococcus asini]